MQKRYCNLPPSVLYYRCTKKGATERAKPLPKELNKIYYSASEKVLDKPLPLWYNQYRNKGRKTH